MDKIILKDYEVLACHGVNEEEKINPQRFLFTVIIDYDFSKAFKTDNVEDTISYALVKKFVKSYCENNSFNLIETLGVGIANGLLKTFDIDSVNVLVKKPDAPMSGVFDYAGVETTRSWHKVYLALGSSLGDKNGYLDLAINELKKDDNFKCITESNRIISEPYGGVASNQFLNSVVECKTLYSPHDLLSRINQIEKAGERVRNIHWEDRTLDIDIIFYDDLIIEDNDLCIPHKDMLNRSFVINPLKELCPNKLHPIIKKRISEI